MNFKQTLKHLVAPRHKEEKRRRTEILLNTILLFSIVIFTLINLIRLVDYFIYKQTTGLPLTATLLILVFFIFLLWLSRRGFIKLASLFLILTFTAPMVYSFLTWGADLPAALILAVLVIVLSGILLGGRAIFISTLLITGGLILITCHQTNGALAPDNYWRHAPVQVADAVAHSLLIMIIALISWLFCKEINKSLRRAQQSEKLLKKERDDLEITVARRTKELLAAEAEKITQLYRLAEFGRLSSGIFHDLINPLSAVSLNLEQIQTETDDKILSAKSYLSQALTATHKMENLISSIKKQISRETVLAPFSLNQEISQSLEILAYKARRADVKICFAPEATYQLIGDALKFGQIINNLVANAIDACETSAKKEIEIALTSTPEKIMINLQDSGVGISPDNQANIFKPFFSTKKLAQQGFGIGLAMTKEIIEHDFKGTIHLKSELGQGTLFIIELPKNL